MNDSNTVQKTSQESAENQTGKILTVLAHGQEGTAQRIRDILVDGSKFDFVCRHIEWDDCSQESFVSLLEPGVEVEKIEFFRIQLLAFFEGAHTSISGHQVLSVDDEGLEGDKAELDGYFTSITHNIDYWSSTYTELISNIKDYISLLPLVYQKKSQPESWKHHDDEYGSGNTHTNIIPNHYLDISFRIGDMFSGKTEAIARELQEASFEDIGEIINELYEIREIAISIRDIPFSFLKSYRFQDYTIFQIASGILKEVNILLSLQN